MKHRYHVAIIGPASGEYERRLKKQVKKRLRELSESLVGFVGFLRADKVETRDKKVPIVTIYFGLEGRTEEYHEVLEKLMNDSTVIIPVVSKLENFSKEIPKNIYGINAAELKPKDKHLDVITNLILENLGLLRRTRRLFISYRRTDSNTEALQLRHELDAQGYDVFLDTHSVPKGDDFQQVLWHRLADSDVVVLLDTPNFMESRWTKEELAQAEAMTIGMIQVIWPEHQPAPYTDLCERIYLTKDDFSSGANQGLKPEVLERIALSVEHLRARSLSARHNNLVREFCDAAASINISAIVQPERFISATLPSGRIIAAIPAVGVIDAMRYHEASHRLSDEESAPSEVFLIYDHRGLRPSWGEFLNWLDDFLPVKAVRITNAAVKLANT